MKNATVSEAPEEALHLVFCTVPDVATARELAGRVLAARLAACVSLGPGVESHYVWQGQREQTTEVLLLLKTSPSAWPALRDFLREAHPYECPEIVAVPALGEIHYAQWVREATGSLPPGAG